MRNELIVKKALEIKVDMLKVWDALINPEKIKQYFFGIDVISDWNVGNPILFQHEMERKKFKTKETFLLLNLDGYFNTTIGVRIRHWKIKKRTIQLLPTSLIHRVKVQS